MLILICKVIGFFQGILKGKKSEFNYHYSKKHHGTECSSLSHVCFTPLSKKQAGRGGCGAAGTPRCAPHPLSAQLGSRHGARGRSRVSCRLLPVPRDREPPAPAGRTTACGTVRPSAARAGCERGGNHVSTGQAQLWKGFLSPSRFVFTKMDFQH